VAGELTDEMTTATQKGRHSTYESKVRRVLEEKKGKAK
jgi:hypothetical protein